MYEEQAPNNDSNASYNFFDEETEEELEVEQKQTYINCDKEFVDSKENHSLFCSKRTEAFNCVFLPKIDQNLLSRFLETFDIDEKYFMILSTKNGTKLVKLNPIKIKSELKNDNKNISVVLSNNQMSLKRPKLIKNNMCFDLISSRTVICLPRILGILDSNLSAEMLFQLLCPCTKEFGFNRSRITPNISFSDIIKKAPNLVDISISFETIVGSKTWIEDLLKYKNGNNFKSFNMMLDIVVLDVESLVEFLKTKCCQPRDMCIWFDEQLFDDEKNNKKLYAIEKKLEEYFEDERFEDTMEEERFLTIGYQTFSLVNVKTIEKSRATSSCVKKKVKFFGVNRLTFFLLLFCIFYAETKFHVAQILVLCALKIL